MKMKRMAAAVAVSAVAASALAVSSSATLVVSENPAHGLESKTNQWTVQLYNAEVGVKYDIDYTKVAKVAYEFRPVDIEWFDGNIGGACSFSCNSGDIARDTPLWDKYNWVMHTFWGIKDEEHEIDCQNPDDVITVKTLGDYIYRAESNVYDNPFAEPDVNEIGCMQTAFQDWGSDFSDYELLKCEIMDASGNIIMTFDPDGNPSTPNIWGQDEAAADDAAAPAEAPAETEAPAQPAAGDVAAATDSSKGSPDTGAADVAVAAGLAIVAAGAVIVSKKRK